MIENIFYIILGIICYFGALHTLYEMSKISMQIAEPVFHIVWSMLSFIISIIILFNSSMNVTFSNYFFIIAIMSIIPAVIIVIIWIVEFLHSIIETIFYQ